MTTAYRAGRLYIRGPAIERLLARVIHGAAGCWLYVGGNNGTGYGTVRMPTGQAYAHRLSYEYFVGAIPDGLQIDHLCNVRACVNPTHLEVVTQAENQARAAARRTTCRHGHPLTPANVYLRRDGYRDCRACWKAA